MNKDISRLILKSLYILSNIWKDCSILFIILNTALFHSQFNENNISGSMFDMKKYLFNNYFSTDWLF